MTDAEAIDLLEFWFSVVEHESLNNDRDSEALEHIRERLWQLRELEK